MDHGTGSLFFGVLVSGFLADRAEPEDRTASNPMSVQAVSTLARTACIVLNTIRQVNENVLFAERGKRAGSFLKEPRPRIILLCADIHLLARAFWQRMTLTDGRPIAPSQRLVLFIERL
jgi:hypothetical protein